MDEPASAFERGVSRLIRRLMKLATPVAMLATPGPAQAELAYTVNQDRISIIDVATSQQVDAIRFDRDNWPSTVAVMPDCAKVYVGHSDSSIVSVIGTASRTVIGTISVGHGPQHLAVTPDGSKLYTANRDSLDVSVVDTARDVVVATITVAHDLALTPDGSSHNLTGVVITPNGGRVYVVDQRANTVAVIDGASNALIATVPVGRRPGDIAISPDGSKVFVADSLSNTVSVISVASNAVAAVVGIDAPQDVWAPPNGELYVRDGHDDVVVMDASDNSVRGRIRTVRSSGVKTIALSRDGARLFIGDGVVCPGVTGAFPGILGCYLLSFLRGQSPDGMSVIDTATDTVVGTVPASDPDVLRAIHTHGSNLECRR